MYGFFIGIVMGFWATIAVLIFAATPDWQWQSQAIERGYALYCPNNGNFAWIGECE